MTHVPGPPEGGAGVHKQGGDALGGSLAYSGAFGCAGQNGGYGAFGEETPDVGDGTGGMGGAGAGAGEAWAGAGGTDQTSIGDISIST